MSSSITNASIHDKIMALTSGSTSYTDTESNPVYTSVQKTDERKMTFMARSVDNDMSIIKALNTDIPIYNRVILAEDYPEGLFFQCPIMAMLGSKDLWVNKLQGVTMIRATAVFTVIINAPPTIAGSVLMSFQPGDTMIQRDELYRSTDSLVVTQRDHAIVDYQDKRGVLRIPYFNGFNGYDLTRSMQAVAYSGHGGDLGTFRVQSFYGPRYTGTLSTISFTVFLHYEDIELGPPGTNKFILNPVPNLVISQMKEPEPILDTENPDVRKQESSSVTKREKSRFKISELLGNVATVAGIASGIPAISSFASSVSWVASTASNVAASFGYSKINQTTKLTPVRNEPSPYGMSGDGLEVANTCGLFVDNQIELVNTVSPSGQDELSLEYLCSKKTYFDQFNFDSNYSTGALLAWFPVTPLSIVSGGQVGARRNNYRPYVVTDPNANYYIPTTLGGVASMFRFWRGTMVYTFRAIKTKFHLGRLLIVWRPNALQTVNSEYTTDVQFCNKIIWDLSETSEVTFEIPYAAATPYLSVFEPRNLSVTETDRNYNGSIAIYVMNPLSATSTVLKNIDITMFHRMKDAQFGVPRQVEPILSTAHVPVPAAMVAGITDVEVDDSFVISEMGVWEHESVQQGVIGTSEIKQTDNIAAYTLGEDVKSLKTITNAYHYCGSMLDGSFNQLQVQWATNHCVTSYYGQVSVYETNALDYIMNAYWLGRGSVRFLVSYSNPNVTQGYSIDVNSIVGNAINSYYANPVDRKMALFKKEFTPIKVPSYINCVAVPITCQPQGVANGYPSSPITMSPKLVLDSYAHAVYRALGDDYQLSGFRGFYITRLPRMN